MTVAGRPSDATTPLLRDPLDALWRGLCRPLTAEILLLLIAGALLAGQIVPQMPAEARGDTSSLARWLADLPALYRAQATWLRAAGLFDAYHAGWFRALLAIAGLALGVTLADELARLWRFLWPKREPAPEVPAAADAAAPAGADSIRAAAAELRRDLLGRRFLVTTTFSGHEARLRAARWPAPALAHLGALALLLGLAVNAALGWQMSGLALPPGQRLAVGGGYELGVERAPLPPVGGIPAHRLTLSRGGRLIRQAPLTAGRPIRAGSLTIWQRALGPLVTAQAAALGDRPGRLEAYPRQGEASATLSLAFGSGETERYFVSLNSGLSYRVVLAGDHLEVEVYRKRETAPALRQELRDGDSVELDGERVAFSLGRYVILDVRDDPAWGALIGGGLLALAGALLALICRPQRLVWRACMTPEGIATESEVLNGGEDARAGLANPAPPGADEDARAEGANPAPAGGEIARAGLPNPAPSEGDADERG